MDTYYKFQQPQKCDTVHVTVTGWTSAMLFEQLAKGIKKVVNSERLLRISQSFEVDKLS